MQLRVARLCLDCEELHVDNSCPVCASDNYAFLSQWLPTEERRRWRRSATTTEPDQDRGGIAAVTEAVSRWLGNEPRVESPAHPLTRQSDHVPDLDFDKARQPDRRPPVGEPRLTKRKA